MDNLARVIMVTLKPGEIVPCVRILKGIDYASRDERCTFKVFVTFNYVTAGGVQSSASGSYLVSESTFVAQLDPMWIRAKGPGIEAQNAPDPSRQITCTAQLSITDNAGTRVDCGLPDTSVLMPVVG